MTTFGWDDSHWGDIPTARDGVDFYTHKCAEGHHFYKDTEYKQAMTSAKALGIPVLGAYFVNHPGTIVDQVDWFLEIVGAETPWYKDVPWMWQIDAEKFPQMDRAPNLAEINAFGDLICSRTGMPSSSVIAYAPKWLYGDKLIGLKYRLWASSYVTGTGGYKTLYPGDSSTRWAAYSEQTPIILQYSSSSIIAGQATCDANAYRGTLEELISLIGGADMSVFSETWNTDGITNVYADKATNPTIQAETALVNICKDTLSATAKLAAMDTKLNQILAQPPVDVDALAAAIVAALPPIEGGITKEDVTEACLAALTKLQIGVT